MPACSFCWSTLIDGTAVTVICAPMPAPPLTSVLWARIKYRNAWFASSFCTIAVKSSECVSPRFALAPMSTVADGSVRLAPPFSQLSRTVCTLGAENVVGVDAVAQAQAVGHATVECDLRHVARRPSRSAQLGSKGKTKLLNASADRVLQQRAAFDLVGEDEIRARASLGVAADSEYSHRCPRRLCCRRY